MYVKSLLPAGAAHRSSLVQVGDCLRKIDGKKVLGKPVDKVSLSLSLSLSLISLSSIRVFKHLISLSSIRVFRHT